MRLLISETWEPMVQTSHHSSGTTLLQASCIVAGAAKTSSLEDAFVQCFTMANMHIISLSEEGGLCLGLVVEAKSGHLQMILVRLTA